MPLELIAMDAPGFAIDEAPKSLGTALKLPPRLEAHCPRIGQVLPSIYLPVAGEARR